MTISLFPLPSLPSWHILSPLQTSHVILTLSLSPSFSMHHCTTTARTAHEHAAQTRPLLQIGSLKRTCLLCMGRELMLDLSIRKCLKVTTIYTFNRAVEHCFIENNHYIRRTSEHAFSFSTFNFIFIFIVEHMHSHPNDKKYTVVDLTQEMRIFNINRLKNIRQNQAGIHVMRCSIRTPGSDTFMCLLWVTQISQYPVLQS